MMNFDHKETNLMSTFRSLSVGNFMGNQEGFIVMAGPLKTILSFFLLRT